MVVIACFFPGRAKDLSAPRYTILHGVTPPEKNHNLSVFPVSCYSNCIFFFVHLPSFTSFRQYFSVSLHSLFLPARLICLFFRSRTFLLLTFPSLYLSLPSKNIYVNVSVFHSVRDAARSVPSAACPFSKSGLPFLAIGEYQVLAISCRYSLPDLRHVALLLIMKLFDPVSTATQGPPGVFVFSVVTSPARSEY